MITPRFELSQDEDFVTVLIQTPYVKISEVDFFISGTEFKFYVKPYFLRLNLPATVVEDGREAASYDVEKGTFTIKLPKAEPGQVFEGLDMLTTLLAPRKKPPCHNQPLIEVLSSDVGTASACCEEDDADDEFDWEIEQVLPEDYDPKLSLEDVKYGFADQKSGVFARREDELHEIADITDPDTMTSTQKRAARLMAEDLKFDPDHYLADYFDEESIQHLLAYDPPWNAEHKQLLQKQMLKHSDSSSTSDEYAAKSDAKKPAQEFCEHIVEFTKEEKDKLRILPNKEYLLDETVERSLMLGLVDIIFAHAYNHHTTEGENTVESAWTINKISSTLSWFETFTSLSDVITACCRRCLSYPLYRNWQLVQRVFVDTKTIFTLGRRRLLKCLLEIHDLFNQEDPHYILNDLYITDYCVWIQTLSNKKLKSLAKRLQKFELKKTDVGWQLDELEKAAVVVNEEEDENSADSSDSSDDESSDNSESSDSESTESSHESTAGQLTDGESTGVVPLSDREFSADHGSSADHESTAGQTSGSTAGQQSNGGFTAGQTSADGSTAGQTSADGSSAGQPSADGSTAGQPSADGSTASQPSDIDGVITELSSVSLRSSHDLDLDDNQSKGDNEPDDNTEIRILSEQIHKGQKKKIVVLSSESF